jgi:RimJ/RimL family protein N-acetyltransferase
VVILRGAEEGEIWYLVEPESWGKGIATESVNHLLDFGFGELGLHRIWATCLPENPASARVMEKVGVPPQEPQDPRSVEEQFFVRHARRGMEACPSNLAPESGSVTG